MTTAHGKRFATAIATRDRQALLDLLADDVDFRGLTPHRIWDAATPTEIVDDVIFGAWFEADDRIDDVERVETDSVVDRQRVAYLFHVTNPNGAFRVEQQVYYDVVDDRIAWLRVMCSGFRPVAAPVTAPA
jgi:hypothetical protein